MDCLNLKCIYLKAQSSGVNKLLHLPPFQLLDKREAEKLLLKTKLFHLTSLLSKVFFLTLNFPLT